jgi:asparagine synthase (glutamine-hydrolysing)
MSGFAGMICAGGSTPDPRLVERMAARLAFRGPDATQIWSRGGAGFCFTLLRTGPAPQASEQPCTLDGRVWLLGDVRLDGRDDLRRLLESANELITAEVCDEELILRAWRRWGTEGLEKLNGDLSFVLWDEDERRLWCVRDLMGARPFFYSQSADTFYFSNTLEVVRLVPELSSVLDAVFIGDFLLQDSCADPARTAFRYISRLPAGHVLRFSNHAVEVRPYTSLPIEEPLWLKRPVEYLERFRTLLESAVRDRLPRGPAAILMSGGLDSTSIAAIANQLTHERGATGSLRAYTVDYNPLFEDEEGYYASLAAEHLSIPIEIFSGATCLPYEGWEDSLLRTPEPSNEPFLLLNRQQYRRVQGHARVALSGLGGDDLLTGQAWPYLVYLLRQSRFGTIGRSFGGYLLKHRRIPPLLGGFRTRFRQWVSHPAPMAEYPRWLEPDFEKRLGLREKWLELQRSRKSAHPLYPLGYAGLTGHYWSGVFEAEDAASTGVPTELRAPLLDQRVLRYLLRVPPVPWCAHKDLLRQTMRGLLPEKIRLRPKTPLRGDSLELHVERGTWSPAPLPKPPAELREFVNWEQLRATLATAASSTLWVGLRPVSLSYWLKGVVNEEKIR